MGEDQGGQPPDDVFLPDVKMLGIIGLPKWVLAALRYKVVGEILRGIHFESQVLSHRLIMEEVIQGHVEDLLHLVQVDMDAVVVLYITDVRIHYGTEGGDEQVQGRDHFQIIGLQS